MASVLQNLQTWKLVNFKKILTTLRSFRIFIWPWQYWILFYKPMESRLEFNSTLEEYNTADNSTSGDFPSDFNWSLFYLIGLAFIFIAIIIAVARIRNKTTRMIWMKNLMLQVFLDQECQTCNQESQTSIRNL